MPEEKSRPPSVASADQGSQLDMGHSNHKAPSSSLSDVSSGRTSGRSSGRTSLVDSLISFGHQHKLLHKPKIPPMPMNLVFMLAVFSLVNYIVDVGSDLALVCQYYANNEIKEGSLTLTFVLLPCVGVLMDKFYRDTFLQTCTCSKERMREVLRGVTEAILLFYTTVKINCLIVYHAWCGYFSKDKRKEHRSQIEKLQNESYGIRFYESTFEALPQLILQAIFCMTAIHDHKIAHQSEILRLVTIISSLVSISWGIASYVGRSPTQVNLYLQPYQMTFLEKMLNFFGHIFVLGANVLALSLAHFGEGYVIIAVLGVRCFIMVTYRKCDKEKKVIKNFSQFALVIVGICVPSNDGDFNYTYKSYILIFLCDFLENTIFIAIWYGDAELSLDYLYSFVIGHYTALMLGVLLMMLFYWRRHIGLIERKTSIVVLAPVTEANGDEEETDSRIEA